MEGWKGAGEVGCAAKKGIGEKRTGQQKRRTLWEGRGDGFGGGWNLRMKINVSQFFGMKVEESEEENICA